MAEFLNNILAILGGYKHSVTEGFFYAVITSFFATAQGVVSHMVKLIFLNSLLKIEEEEALEAAELEGRYAGYLTYKRQLAEDAS